MSGYVACICCVLLFVLHLILTLYCIFVKLKKPKINNQKCLFKNNEEKKRYIAASLTGSLHLNRDRWGIFFSSFHQLENRLKFIEDVYILPRKKYLILIWSVGVTGK